MKKTKKKLLISWSSHTFDEIMTPLIKELNKSFIIVIIIVTIVLTIVIIIRIAIDYYINIYIYTH